MDESSYLHPCLSHNCTTMLFESFKQDSNITIKKRFKFKLLVLSKTQKIFN